MTTLELYNLALSFFDREITQTDIDSATPPREVRLCTQYLQLARHAAMREFDWSFLIVPVEIDAEDDTPDYGFSHGYKLPAGLVTLVHVGSDHPYEVRGGRLYMDGKPKMYGIMEAIPEEGVPRDFYEVIAYSLAFRIAPMLAPASKLDQVILQRYTWAVSNLISAECHNNYREE